jgi:hypothetical protein
VSQFLTLPFGNENVAVQQGWFYNTPLRGSVIHNGIDFILGIPGSAPSTWMSFDVRAAASGVAMQSVQQDANGNEVGYGKFILVRHNEVDEEERHYFTLYAHLRSVVSKIPVRQKHDTNFAEWVSITRGEKIGEVGDSGSPGIVHLHFEVNRGGYAQNKVDPYDIEGTRELYANTVVCDNTGPDFLWTECPPSFAPPDSDLVLYDDFNAPDIDPDRWIGSSFSTGPAPLQIIREIQSNRLRMVNHVLGRTDTDSGGSFTGNFLDFANPENITSIEVTIQVTQADATGCPDGNLGVTEASARVQGNFFNFGPPVPGTLINDMNASIHIQRLSNSPDPPGVLEVFALLHQCADANCSTGQVERFDLGTIMEGERTKVRMTWDPDNDRFIFRREDLDDSDFFEVFANYTVSDTAPATSPFKHLSAIGFVANCTAVPRPEAFTEAFFDDVFINASAVPLSGTVQGFVRLEQTGDPVDGANVELLDVNTFDLIAQTQSDSNGFYQFTSVPPGDYVVFAGKEGAGFGAVDVSVAAGQTVKQDIEISVPVPL